MAMLVWSRGGDDVQVRAGSAALFACRQSACPRVDSPRTASHPIDDQDHMHLAWQAMMLSADDQPIDRPA